MGDSFCESPFDALWNQIALLKILANVTLAKGERTINLTGPDYGSRVHKAVNNKIVSKICL
ncbi:hypothetical protein [Roseobacter sp. HKCCA0882]|uniref:hypothetical protein n=1 Tax=Roseobacter sp. HKCCA0882 TaxID=3120337 RepID=UPI0030EF639C